jgi:CheY-like chemotaxis protein
MPSRVLVVEDNPVVRQMMLNHLNGFSLNCYAVTTGEEAIALAEYFDLILMDCQLPGISGVEATKQIRLKEARKQLQPVPIVATTSLTNRTEFLKAGMNDHYCKPISQANISRILDDWIFCQPQRLRELG